jgi:hypothetical protein
VRAKEEEWRRVVPDHTFPQQMSSTKFGSRLDFSMTFFNREYRRKSNCVSLNPPLTAFASGVRMARVITTSSAFLEVLLEISKRHRDGIPEKPT